MSDFHIFKKVVTEQFNLMALGQLYVVELEKNEIWEAYLDSFPEGTNEMFRERREYDCSACKSFIRIMGGAVAIVNHKLVSIWDVTIDIEKYQVVADALSKLVKSKVIKNQLLYFQKNVGVDYNIEQLENGDSLKWHHFFCRLPNEYLKTKENIPTILSDVRSTKDVFRRGLEEIKVDALESVLELIDQNSLYRGEEFRDSVARFFTVKHKFDKITPALRDNFCWDALKTYRDVAKIRNSAIGTLINDLSDGRDLNDSVASYEAKVAPTNYKRPKAIFTQRMIEDAKEKIEELGFSESLGRRFAVIEDITANDILFANRDARKKMAGDVFEELTGELPAIPRKFDKVEEVSIKDFIKNIIPSSTSVEMFVENSHEQNLVTLIAPQNQDAPSMFKWGNNFSWAYNGDIADSMKKRVKALGGNVEGVLRFSIQWNDGDDNQNDFDAHCREPNGGKHIYFSNKRIKHPSSGMLDVDIISPKQNVAVENITWTDPSRMPEGRYKFHVHNYSHNGGRTGFTAEVEYNGEIHSYVYNKELRQNEDVPVAEFIFSRTGECKIIDKIDSSVSSREIWGIKTLQFYPVATIMYSPNYWGGKRTGNRHYFFMLADCENVTQPRGFFNEFLNEKLLKHKRVFEALGSKMRVAESDNQLSGLGFSSTQKNAVMCRVIGKTTRILKIKF